MKTIEQLQKEWGESNDGTTIEQYIYDYFIGCIECDDAHYYFNVTKPAIAILKSMTLSMAAHPDCFKRPDGASSEFYDLVEKAEKVIESTI